MPGVVVVDAGQHQGVQLADDAGRNRVSQKKLGFFSSFTSQRLNQGDGVAVVDDLEVLAQALAADGDTLLQDELRLAQGQRAALDGVGVVGPFDGQLLFQAADGGRGQGAQRVKAGLFGLEAGEKALVEHARIISDSITFYLSDVQFADLSALSIIISVSNSSP